jgi:hypothetical protein
MREAIALVVLCCSVVLLFHASAHFGSMSGGLSKLFNASCIVISLEF